MSGRTWCGPGSVGFIVQGVQAALSMPQPRLGIWDEATSEALCAFQAENGLPLSDCVDQETWEALPIEGAQPPLISRIASASAFLTGLAFAAAKVDVDGLRWGLLAFSSRSGLLFDVLELIPEEIRIKHLGREKTGRLQRIARWDPSRRAMLGQIVRRNKGHWAKALRQLGATEEAVTAQQVVLCSQIWPEVVSFIQETSIVSELGYLVVFDLYCQLGSLKAWERQAAAGDEPERDRLVRLVSAGIERLQVHPVRKLISKEVALRFEQIFGGTLISPAERSATLESFGISELPVHPVAHELEDESQQGELLLGVGDEEKVQYERPLLGEVL